MTIASCFSTCPKINILNAFSSSQMSFCGLGSLSFIQKVRPFILFQCHIIMVPEKPRSSSPFLTHEYLTSSSQVLNIHVFYHFAVCCKSVKYWMSVQPSVNPILCFCRIQCVTQCHLYLFHLDVDSLAIHHKSMICKHFIVNNFLCHAVFSGSVLYLKSMFFPYPCFIHTLSMPCPESWSQALIQSGVGGIYCVKLSVSVS